MRIAVVISANAEWQSVRPLFPNAEAAHYLYGEFFPAAIGDLPVMFFHAGWGKTASAGALQYILDHYGPDLVVNLGTCGGFAGTVQRGDTGGARHYL